MKRFRSHLLLYSGALVVGVLVVVMGAFAGSALQQQGPPTPCTNAVGPYDELAAAAPALARVCHISFADASDPSHLADGEGGWLYDPMVRPSRADFASMVAVHSPNVIDLASGTSGQAVIIGGRISAHYGLAGPYALVWRHNGQLALTMFADGCTDAPKVTVGAHPAATLRGAVPYYVQAACL
jgi:hypothetical protein